MKNIIIIFALFSSGCIATAGANTNVDNSPQAMAKSEAIRRELCNKHHYPNVKFVRVGGKKEIYKIHVEVQEQTVYECKF